MTSSVAGRWLAHRGVFTVPQRLPAAVAAIAAFALLTIAVPGPIVLDLLGASLAALGLGIICENDTA